MKKSIGIYFILLVFTVVVALSFSACSLFGKKVEADITVTTLKGE